MNMIQRKQYEVGQLTLRNPSFKRLQNLSPMERGAELLSKGVLREVNPLNLTKTWRTGLTPGAKFVAPYFFDLFSAHRLQPSTTFLAKNGETGVDRRGYWCQPIMPLRGTMKS